jgi:hypothetical protein
VLLPRLGCISVSSLSLTTSTVSSSASPLYTHLIRDTDRNGDPNGPRSRNAPFSREMDSSRPKSTYERPDRVEATNLVWVC